MKRSDLSALLHLFSIVDPCSSCARHAASQPRQGSAPGSGRRFTRTAARTFLRMEPETEKARQRPLSLAHPAQLAKIPVANVARLMRSAGAGAFMACLRAYDLFVIIFNKIHSRRATMPDSLAAS